MLVLTFLLQPMSFQAIQSMGDGEEIEPVRFSFGDNVITQDIYQEIVPKSLIN